MYHKMWHSCSSFAHLFQNIRLEVVMYDLPELLNLRFRWGTEGIISNWESKKGFLCFQRTRIYFCISVILLCKVSACLVLPVSFNCREDTTGYRIWHYLTSIIKSNVLPCSQLFMCPKFAFGLPLLHMKVKLVCCCYVQYSVGTLSCKPKVFLVGYRPKVSWSASC